MFAVYCALALHYSKVGRQHMSMPHVDNLFAFLNIPVHCYAYYISLQIYRDTQRRTAQWQVALEQVC